MNKLTPEEIMKFVFYLEEAAKKGSEIPYFKDCCRILKCNLMIDKKRMEEKK